MVKLVSKQASQCQDQLSQKTDKFSGVKTQIEKCERELAEAREAKRQKAVEVKKHLFTLNEQELTLKSLKSKLQHHQQLVDKCDATYITVRRVDAACRQQKIEGYYGLLIDHLAISDARFHSVIDIAAKSKLFSLLVDSVQTA